MNILFYLINYQINFLFLLGLFYYRNDLDTIYPAWKKWLSNARKLGFQNAKGRNLVQIRADKEKKLGDVRNCFNKWVYVKKMLDAQDKLAKEREKKPDTKVPDLKKN